MKVELHLHTSRLSGCAANAPQETMRRLIETGYGAVYVTEHDAVWPQRELEALRRAFPEIRIFPGVELTLGSGGFQHLLVLGTDDPAYLSLGGAAAILEKARDEGHLTILAHPFRWEGAAEMLDDGLRPDVIEHRTCNHEPHMAEASAEAARRLGLPVVNAGDVHALSFINRFWIETADDLARPDDIRQVVREGRYVNCSAGE